MRGSRIFRNRSTLRTGPAATYSTARTFMIRFYLTILTLFTMCSYTSPEADAQGGPDADSTLPLPTEWSTYYVVLLKEGPTRPEDLSRDSLRTIMSDHIQYQLRLQKSGQALAGGGFRAAGDDVLGMTLLRVGSIEEAKRLAEDDPAVAAGRFSAVVYEWYVPAGTLPE